MQKIFNRKNTVIFTVLLLVCFLAASSLLIVRDSFNNKAEELIAAANKTDGEGSELSEKLAGWLTNLLGELGKEGEDGKTDGKTDKVVSKEAEACLKKGKTCLGFSIALYVLTVIFMGMDIACAAYASYLESPKYEAKLRLMRMAEKRKKSMTK